MVLKVLIMNEAGTLIYCPILFVLENSASGWSAIARITSQFNLMKTPFIFHENISSY